MSAGFTLAILFLSTVSCRKEMSICQSVKDGVFSEIVNGKALTCEIVNTPNEPGGEIVLVCTNETDYNVTIEVMVNNNTVGTITQFPAEFRFISIESGTYQFSIFGKLYPKNNPLRLVTSFRYGWSIPVLQ